MERQHALMKSNKLLSTLDDRVFVIISNGSVDTGKMFARLLMDVYHWPYLQEKNAASVKTSPYLTFLSKFTLSKKTEIIFKFTRRTYI